MSPANPPRQLLVWSLPTIAVLLSYLWFKRRKNPAICAPEDGIDPTKSTRLTDSANSPAGSPGILGSSGTTAGSPGFLRSPGNLGASGSLKSSKSPGYSASPDSSPIKAQMSATTESPVTSKRSPQTSKPVSFSRSLSGVESTPIDIKTGRSAPLVISDTELDLEIEKIKSMKNGTQTLTMSSPLKRRTPKKQTPTNTSNSTNSTTSESTNITTNTTNSESMELRDSANHSPADAMMPASPSLSSISDNQSDSDSGKGGSDVATPPPPATQQAPAPGVEVVEDIEEEGVTIYEFIIPQQLVGRLIGRHGAFVHTIREKTNARIIIKRHPDHQSKLKICSIEGLSVEIDAALRMIRDKFPLKRFPDLTLEQISYVPIVPDCMHLRLIEGVNNDTIVSCVQTPAHLFLQQPTHPTFPNLNMLVDYMMYCYGDVSCPTQPPLLPTPITPGTICAAECDNRWYRASVTRTEPDNGIACIQFLDYGGYANVSYSQLRQIRGDFILLPFQASECMLANVEPAGEVTDTEDGWSQEAYDTVVEMTRGNVVFTQVVDYLEDGVTPLVRIYIQPAEQRGAAILLNKVLADRGYARWVETR